MENKVCQWIEEWYLENRAEEWGGTTSVKIETIDNPGWSVKINLQETNLENKSFHDFFDDKSEDDWILCEVREGFFHGAGDAEKLSTILKIFKEWAEG